MRRRRRHAGLTVNAIAGTYVVFFGVDLAPSKRAGFRGFAFKRHDHLEGDTIWLQGMKTFEQTEPHSALGERFSTLHHPIQSFQWADYSAKPGVSYTYTVVALYGDPASLERRIEIEIDVTTETETGGVHSAFFNRGSVATQEYARRFQNKPPSEAGPGAYEWLSRGLLEALVAFLGRAGAGWDVHGAVYEFQRPEALAAVRQAHLRGATVKVLYDEVVGFDRDGAPDGPFQRNRDAISAAKIKDLCDGRSNARLSNASCPGRDRCVCARIRSAASAHRVGRRGTTVTGAAGRALRGARGARADGHDQHRQVGGARRPDVPEGASPATAEAGRAFEVPWNAVSAGYFRRWALTSWPGEGSPTSRRSTTPPRRWRSSTRCSPRGSGRTGRRSASTCASVRTTATPRPTR